MLLLEKVKAILFFMFIILSSVVNAQNKEYAVVEIKSTISREFWGEWIVDEWHISGVLEFEGCKDNIDYQVLRNYVLGKFKSEIGTIADRVYRSHLSSIRVIEKDIYSKEDAISTQGRLESEWDSKTKVYGRGKKHIYRVKWNDGLEVCEYDSKTDTYNQRKQDSSITFLTIGEIKKLDEDPNPLADTDYDRLLAKANRFYDKGDYLEAQKYFARAKELKPSVQNTQLDERLKFCNQILMGTTLNKAMDNASKYFDNTKDIYGSLDLSYSYEELKIFRLGIQREWYPKFIYTRAGINFISYLDLPFMYKKVDEQPGNPGEGYWLGVRDGQDVDYYKNVPVDLYTLNLLFGLGININISRVKLAIGVDGIPAGGGVGTDGFKYFYLGYNYNAKLIFKIKNKAIAVSYQFNNTISEAGIYSDNFVFYPEPKPNTTHLIYFNELVDQITFPKYNLITLSYMWK